MELNKKKMGRWLLRGLVGAALMGFSWVLLRREAVAFLTWWILTVLLGMMFMPVTAQLFAGFADRGWMFSKALAIGATGFLTWFLVSIGLLPFTSVTCMAVTVVCCAGCAVLFLRQSGEELELYPWQEGSLIFRQEVLFFLFFLIAVYIAGFRPETSNSTEKFMDFGFMQAMMRSTSFPPQDIWYAGEGINYYYGGQYFAVFLSRLTGTSPEITYNISRMLVAAFSFSLSGSLVYQLLLDRAWKKRGGKKIAAAGGVLAGLAVSIAGNMHYVVYALVLPLWQKLQGLAESSYWFPDATRYIGHNPDVADDKTIHEFPCYSFVLGDLHAHVANILFVLLLLGLLYAWMQCVRREREKIRQRGRKACLLTSLAQPHLLLVFWLLGIYHWTNFWDFVIYFVVTGGVVLFMNIILYRGNVRKILLVTALQAAEAIAVSSIIILPFTLQFQSMVTSVALVQKRTRIYQLLVLWGLPFAVTGTFALRTLLKWRKKKLHDWLASLRLPDLFVFILSLCAMGLVAIPEFVYVRDIYEGSSPRANTMFKLTYQAFIMFGICMGYLLIRGLAVSRRWVTRAAALLCTVCLLSTMLYGRKAVVSWYGNVLDRDGYQSLNTTAFLETDYPEDAAAIRWLSKNVEGQPVVLEANGDSYSAYCRVSAMTGLPTIIGWYVHEWLWRSDPDSVSARCTDVETIYTSTDEEQVKALLREYNVSYIFVGSSERERYGSMLNRELLNRLGDVAYRDFQSPTYIIEVKL